MARNINHGEGRLAVRKVLENGQWMKKFTFIHHVQTQISMEYIGRRHTVYAERHGPLSRESFFSHYFANLIHLMEHDGIIERDWHGKAHSRSTVWSVRLVPTEFERVAKENHKAVIIKKAAKQLNLPVPKFKGEHCVKLNLPLARQIRVEKLNDINMTQKKLAEKYGVSRQAICDILCNVVWKEPALRTAKATT